MCVRTDITSEANTNQPVAVDVVLARDKDLIKTLMKMPAADWFKSREQFARDYPSPKDLIIIHREWVPGEPIPCQSIPLDPKPKATFLFANYFSKGDHRARLPNGKSVAVHLGDEDFTLEPLKECPKEGCRLGSQ